MIKKLGICYCVVIGMLEKLDVLILVVFEEIGKILFVFDGSFYFIYFSKNMI